MEIAATQPTATPPSEMNLEQTFLALAWPRLASGKSSSIYRVLMDLGVLDFVECAKSTRNAPTGEFPFP